MGVAGWMGDGLLVLQFRAEVVGEWGGAVALATAGGGWHAGGGGWVDCLCSAAGGRWRT